LETGFSMRFTLTAFLPAILFFCSCGQSIEEIEKLPIDEKGKALYENNCASCHGVDGKMGNSGAKDLSESTLTDQETINAILYGNEKGMPPFKDQLGSEENITLLLAYVKSLRK
jgi:cytochrome c553